MTVIEQAVDVLQKAKKVVFSLALVSPPIAVSPRIAKNFLESGQDTIRGI